MKTILLVSFSLLLSINLNAQTIKNVINAAGNYINGNGTAVSNDEIIKGLKEALSVGAKNSANKASAVNGFYKNSLIKIPFPPEVSEMQSRLISLGMKPQVDKFVETLNRAAEKAAKDAAPIFLNAITSMSLTDGISVLKGGDNAATKYLKDKTNAELMAKFLPVVKNSLAQVQITKYWNPLATRYNKIPLVKKANPNLENYVTLKAIEGLFKLVGQEELKIRKDPASRISELLKKVFG